MKFGVRFLAIFSILSLVPNISWACACGCGVFDVATSSMLPVEPGGMAWLQYDYMDQNHNMSGTNGSPANLNGDKEIRSNFYTAGAEYMFNRDWGIRGELPVDDRFLRTTDDAGNIVNSDHTAFGDMVLEAVYTGLSSDMSTGITFGFKLPTGQYTYSGFDRDTETGTGSTDTRIGAYHLGHITSDGVWNWFAQGVWDHPVETADHYRPGDEIDVAGGVYYTAPEWNGIRFSPLAQLIGSERWHDEGSNSDPDNTGYNRVLISPGLEADYGNVVAYADVEFPVYQDVKGNQLTATNLVKVSLGYKF